MAAGPGKYDHWCTVTREGTDAQAVVLVVLNGNRGSGFSVQAHSHLAHETLADLLEHVALQIRREAPNAQNQN